VPRPHRADGLKPAKAVRGIDLAALGLVHELVQSRDLVQPQRSDLLRRGLDRRPPALPEGDHDRGRQHDDARSRVAVPTPREPARPAITPAARPPRAASASARGSPPRSCASARYRRTTRTDPAS
jgi:hypothetical protein